MSKSDTVVCAAGTVVTFVRGDALVVALIGREAARQKTATKAWMPYVSAEWALRGGVPVRQVAVSGWPQSSALAISCVRADGEAVVLRADVSSSAIELQMMARYSGIVAMCHTAAGHTSSSVSLRVALVRRQRCDLLTVSDDPEACAPEDFDTESETDESARVVPTGDAYWPRWSDHVVALRERRLLLVHAVSGRTTLAQRFASPSARPRFVRALRLGRGKSATQVIACVAERQLQLFISPRKRVKTLMLPAGRIETVRAEDDLIFIAIRNNDIIKTVTVRAVQTEDRFVWHVESERSFRGEKLRIAFWRKQAVLLRDKTVRCENLLRTAAFTRPIRADDPTFLRLAQNGFGSDLYASTEAVHDVCSDVHTTLVACGRRVHACASLNVGVLKAATRTQHDLDRTVTKFGYAKRYDALWRRRVVQLCTPGLLDSNNAFLLTAMPPESTGASFVKFGDSRHHFPTAPQHKELEAGDFNTRKKALLAALRNRENDEVGDTSSRPARKSIIDTVLHATSSDHGASDTDGVSEKYQISQVVLGALKAATLDFKGATQAFLAAQRLDLAALFLSTSTNTETWEQVAHSINKSEGQDVHLRVALSLLLAARTSADWNDTVMTHIAKLPLLDTISLAALLLPRAHFLAYVRSEMRQFAATGDARFLVLCADAASATVFLRRFVTLRPELHLCAGVLAVLFGMEVPQSSGHMKSSSGSVELEAVSSSDALGAVAATSGTSSAGTQLGGATSAVAMDTGNDDGDGSNDKHLRDFASAERVLLCGDRVSLPSSLCLKWIAMIVESARDRLDESHLCAQRAVWDTWHLLLYRTHQGLPGLPMTVTADLGSDKSTEQATLSYECHDVPQVTLKCRRCNSVLPHDSDVCVNTACGDAILRCSVCRLRVKLPSPMAWCPVCLHGGHADHLTQWFDSGERHCAVPSCDCICRGLD